MALRNIPHTYSCYHECIVVMTKYIYVISRVDEH